MAVRRLPPFEQLGAFMHAHRRAVIGVWLGVLLLALPFAPQAPGALQAGGFDLPTLESARARALLEEELGAPPSALVLAIPHRVRRCLLGSEARRFARGTRRYCGSTRCR
ncbi:MAG: hypothetical protein EBX81_04880 [bacterium]|nr:hypothetical protein [Candidatus Aquidulcis sp.]